MPTFTNLVEGIGLVIDGVGVLAIVLGLLVATIRFAAAGIREADRYARYRHDLGRRICSGLSARRGRYHPDCRCRPDPRRSDHPRIDRSNTHVPEYGITARARGPMALATSECAAARNAHSYPF